MRTILLAFMILLSSGGFASRNDTVYISRGCKAYAYHKTIKCKHLKRCLEEGHVEAVSLSKAKEMGRTPCGTCYKK